MKELVVRTPGSAYSVYVGHGLSEHAHELIPPPERAEMAVVVSDVASHALHGARLREGLAPWGLRMLDVSVEPGETSKDRVQLFGLWAAFAREGVHRPDVVVAHGGGVVSDLAGFAAATYLRGIPWVVAPTTLLGMVDAAIGGKTGIDLAAGKNLVGAFHHPFGVIADTECLATLPDAEISTGLAEVVKHGLIAPGDLLERTLASAAAFAGRDVERMTPIVADAAAVKVAVVSKDPRERGVRAHLNYGHTLGHALETVGGYTEWTHGRAIAVGMMFAAHLAAELGMGDRVALHREALEAVRLPTTGAGYDYEAIVAAWMRDKKYEAGMRFVLLADRGKPEVVGDIPETALRKAYEAVR